jgi:hypothetical protein
MALLNRHRNLVLLLLLLATQVTLPMGAMEGRAGRFAFDLLYTCAALVTLVVVFEGARERTFAFLLLLPALVLVVGEYALHTLSDAHAALVYHGSVALFGAAAVVAIVRAIFRRHAVSIDDVLGAFAGYLILGLLWGNVYAMVELAAPASFSVNPDIRWQLEDWHLRRALFNYFSLANLSSLGYTDITAIAPLSNTLTWLEVMAAQFYMAVVVAQIVGLKLARALAENRRDRS